MVSRVRKPMARQIREHSTPFRKWRQQLRFGELQLSGAFSYATAISRASCAWSIALSCASSFFVMQVCCDVAFFFTWRAKLGRLLVYDSR